MHIYFLLINEKVLLVTKGILKFKLMGKKIMAILRSSFVFIRLFQKCGILIITQTKSDSDVIFCLKLLSKIFTCTLILS